MALSCPTTIRGYRIKNTHNFEAQDRETNKFKIFTSTSCFGPWTEILDNNIPDARNVAPVHVLQFPVTPQYIMFQIDTYYRNGRGLQYIATY